MSEAQRSAPDRPVEPAAAGGSRHATPAETLSGNRLCMRCMHPLVGSAIERDAETGLLYVRCGECGTASALFEYPTVGPWLQRMKTVAVSTLLLLVLGVALATAAISFGFTLGTANVTCEAASEALGRRWRDLGGTTEDPTWGIRWSNADATWLASEAGRAELDAVRTAPETLIPLVAMVAVGVLVLSPFALFLGVGCMRRSWPVRALIAAFVVGGGSAIAIFVSLTTSAGVRPSPSWLDAVESHSLLYFGGITATVLALGSAAVAALAPAFTAAAARFILPASDRRLVSWLWEWRGKPVPRD